jgi:hypothetical protein
MAQIVSSQPLGRSGKILCSYLNATNQTQVGRVTNIPNWYLERVIFPGQRLLFEALPDAQLEIHESMMGSAILSDKISCSCVRVNEGLSYSFKSRENERVQNSQLSLIATASEV